MDERQKTRYSRSEVHNMDEETATTPSTEHRKICISRAAPVSSKTSRRRRCRLLRPREGRTDRPPTMVLLGPPTSPASPRESRRRPLYNGGGGGGGTRGGRVVCPGNDFGRVPFTIYYFYVFFFSFIYILYMSFCVFLLNEKSIIPCTYRL